MDIINQNGAQSALDAIQDQKQAVEKRRELATSFMDEANETDKKLGGQLVFRIEDRYLPISLFTEGRGVREYNLIGISPTVGDKPAVGFGYKENGEPLFDIIKWTKNDKEEKIALISPVTDSNLPEVQTIINDKLEHIKYLAQRDSRKLTSKPTINVD